MIASCSALLGWDEQTYLPRGGSAYRGDQMALLAGLHHERATDPALGDLLADVASSDLVADLDSPTAANIRQWQRSFDQLRRMPRALVEELARATTLAQGVWVEARKDNSFDAFRPSLEAIIALKKQEGACLADPGDTPYDALLDEYEPGAKVADLTPLFESLRGELVPLVAAIAGSSRPSPPTFRANTPWPISESSARPSPPRSASTSSAVASTPRRTRSAVGSALAIVGSPPGSTPPISPTASSQSSTRSATASTSRG